MSIDNMEARIRRALTERFGAEVAEGAELENRGGHASLRIYWRVRLPIGADSPRGEGCEMAMVLPQSADAWGSEEGMPAAVEVPTELPFVNVQRYLDAIGMAVPAIDFVDLDLGVLLLEDLGDQTFEKAVLQRRRSGAEPADLYRQAIDVLVDFQTAVLQSTSEPTDACVDDCVAFGREFDGELLRWELDHYRQWGLRERADARQAAHLDSHEDDFARVFGDLVDALLDVRQTLVLRDYQSRNLMHKAGDWQIIDFQDALRGPFVYDLVALLRDSYIGLDPAQVESRVDHYITSGDQAGLPWCADPEAVYEAFYLQTIQRKLKDAGRFVYIERTKGDASFMTYYDDSIRYVRQALDKLAGWNELAELLEVVEPRWQP